ncbi:DUF924 family protein [Brachymonas chironomi]|uniref:DUF924 family protein n=1 Tax=Brachymonas chironomi TaxID=491919 RepID=UPI000375C9AB|nr:DUF924 family protein [Brachymonas chironomi]
MTTQTTLPDAGAVLQFWFDETTPKQWFAVDAGFDALVTERFGGLLQAAAHCELADWRGSARGRLAEIIVLDQFSRNVYRGTAQAFAQDAQALVLAQEAMAAGCDQALPPPQRAFLYLPYMHSESALIQQQSVQLFDQPGLEDNYRFALLHRDIVVRFGRYPHRNAQLGRVSTPAELEFLQQPGSSF